jgi:hypothetical protein
MSTSAPASGAAEEVGVEPGVHVGIEVGEEAETRVEVLPLYAATHASKINNNTNTLVNNNR